jgi:hypothetical protein
MALGFLFVGAIAGGGGAEASASAAVAAADSPAICPNGQSWCALNGRCTDPACLACCQFGTSCAATKDCGSACVTCPNGSAACAVGQCGTELAGQCFYPPPVCPGPAAVPALPRWLVPAAASALLLLGVRMLARRGRDARREGR